MGNREIPANKTFKGKDGEVWVNGKQIGTATEFEVKATIDYEEYKLAGRTYRESQGFALSGTLTSVKIDNTFLNMLADIIRGNITTEFSVIGKETSSEHEVRIAFTGVTFDEYTLVGFTQGESRKEATPFKAVDFNIINAN